MKIVADHNTTYPGFIADYQLFCFNRFQFTPEFTKYSLSRDLISYTSPHPRIKASEEIVKLGLALRANTFFYMTLSLDCQHGFRSINDAKSYPWNTPTTDNINYCGSEAKNHNFSEHKNNLKTRSNNNLELTYN